MTVLAIIRVGFNRAARDVARESEFLVRPSLRVEKALFQEIFDPVRKVFENGRFYAGNEPLEIPQLVKEFRSMCLEAQLAHTTTDSCTRARRTRLLNASQNIAEHAEEGVSPDGTIAADMDLFYFPELGDVITEAAMIQKGYLNNPDVCEALMGVAKNIDTAHKRLWQPKTSDTKVADNYTEDSKTTSQRIAEAKAEIVPGELLKADMPKFAQADNYAALNVA